MELKNYCIGFFIVVAVAACGSEKDNRAEVAACIERGIEYYKDFGSYPRLSDGRDALQVVTERCNRTTTAF